MLKLHKEKLFGNIKCIKRITVQKEMFLFGSRLCATSVFKNMTMQCITKRIACIMWTGDRIRRNELKGEE